jgi:hypothetical protein
MSGDWKCFLVSERLLGRSKNSRCGPPDRYRCEIRMRAIILAAGRGSRMKNLTDERPKCLVELRGKTLLEWQLGALRHAGINEIAHVT